MTPKRSSRGARMLEVLGSAVVVSLGLLWMLVGILIVASPFILMLALAYWLVRHA